MRSFFGSKFIEKKKLEEAGIDYPIKLEYYKVVNDEENYGIQIVKTGYPKGEPKTEKNEIKYVADDEKIINKMLKILKENEVTPITLQDIICDFKNFQNMEY